MWVCLFKSIAVVSGGSLLSDQADPDSFPCKAGEPLHFYYYTEKSTLTRTKWIREVTQHEPTPHVMGTHVLCGATSARDPFGFLRPKEIQ
jgi:hypothetical protein